MQELFSSLYAYNQWANEKIVQLCAGLTDAQLDQPKEMGFGTLRKTLFHILTADVVWMERWESTPWREFPTDLNGKSIAEIAAALGDVGRRRLGLIESISRMDGTPRSNIWTAQKHPTVISFMTCCFTSGYTVSTIEPRLQELMTQF